MNMMLVMIDDDNEFFRCLLSPYFLQQCIQPSFHIISLYTDTITSEDFVLWADDVYL